MSMWSKIYNYSKEKLREKHLTKYSVDLKCPNCNEWFSISAINYKHLHEPVWFGSACTCGQCSHKSYWNMTTAAAPLLSDDMGNPL